MNWPPQFGDRHVTREKAEWGFKLVLAKLFGSRPAKVTLSLWLFVLSLAQAFAGYTIKTTQIETTTGGSQFTWTVFNEDEAWGLDMFAIEVPAELRVLAYTVPPPYSNPNGTAYWIMQQSHDAWKDPHDSRVIVPAPQRGKKWLLWWGMQSPSVYPQGTTVTFSITTDSSVKVGNVRGYPVTYTPRNNPHYYLAWPEEIIGPSVVLDQAVAATSSADELQMAVPGVLAGPILNPVNGHSYYLLPKSTWSNAEAQAVRLGGHLATIRNAAEDHWVYSTFGSYGGAL